MTVLSYVHTATGTLPASHSQQLRSANVCPSLSGPLSVTGFSPCAQLRQHLSLGWRGIEEEAKLAAYIMAAHRPWPQKEKSSHHSFLYLEEDQGVWSIVGGHGNNLQHFFFYRLQTGNVLAQEIWDKVVSERRYEFNHTDTNTPSLNVGVRRMYSQKYWPRQWHINTAWVTQITENVPAVDSLLMYTPLHNCWWQSTWSFKVAVTLDFVSVTDLAIRKVAAVT